MTNTTKSSASENVSYAQKLMPSTSDTQKAQNQHQSNNIPTKKSPGTQRQIINIEQVNSAVESAMNSEKINNEYQIEPNKPIIGASRNRSFFETLPTLGYIHISRIHPDMTAVDLSKFLKETAPQIRAKKSGCTSLLKALSAIHVKMSKSNEDIYRLLETLTTQNSEIVNQNTEIKEEVQKINCNIHEIKGEIERLHVKNNLLEEDNKNLRNRLDILEKKAKKFNLVIYGIPEEEDNLIAVEKLVTEKLSLDCNKGDIRDSYRIGKVISSKPRPLVTEFVRYSLKTEILAKARILEKGSGIFISNDYSPAEYNKRKVLHQHLKAAREKHNSAYIKNNILFVNGESFSFEDLENSNPHKPTGPNKNLEASQRIEKVNPTAVQNTKTGTKPKVSVNQSNKSLIKTRSNSISTK
ncbi:unnamed protein product [Phaedon cochleariae]|uniref:Uncharacterized protein n=1 Tax=Phaedon cochleariae TaxID=80249 RepID=A0A9P0DL89_PHACE|nr:unnamed protein product [Phaedon cochleariae]